MTNVEIPMAKNRKKNIFLHLRPELSFDIVQSEIGDEDPGDLLLRVMTGETFLPIVNGINISENLFSSGRGIDHGLIECLCCSMVADLAGGITDVDGLSHLFIVDGDDNPADSVEDEDVLDIRVIIDHLKDIFHFI